MVVYVTQIAYPDDEPDGGMMGDVLAVSSEWNKAVRAVMEKWELASYTEKRKINDNTWEIHIDGDLYVHIIKFTIDEPYSNYV